jgi:hypothetical protein
VREDHAQTISWSAIAIPSNFTALSSVSRDIGTGSHDESASEQRSVIRKAAWQSSEKLMFNQN